LLDIRNPIANETTDLHESWPGPDQAVTLECPLRDTELLRDFFLAEKLVHEG
jgi:hypothetical protein